MARATTKRPERKRPLAHEVILARLEQHERGIIRRRKQLERALPGNVQNHTLDIVELRWYCHELLNVLSRMHLPEHERPKIQERLRALDAQAIGGYEISYVHLLQRLSGHSPAHVAGTQPKRRT